MKKRKTKKIDDKKRSTFELDALCATGWYDR